MITRCYMQLYVALPRYHMSYPQEEHGGDHSQSGWPEKFWTFAQTSPSSALQHHHPLMYPVVTAGLPWRLHICKEQADVTRKSGRAKV